MAARLGWALARQRLLAQTGKQEFEIAECKRDHDLTSKKEIIMADSDIKRITTAVEDAVTYPILTSDITTRPPSDRTGLPGPGGGPSLGRMAQDTLRQVLGWRYRTDDPKGFTAALTKAFLLKQVGDHTEWELKPQNYMVQADLGEITGAQASIYARAKAALDHALPLLDGLTPLRPDADESNTESMRAMVRSALKGLVDELGLVDGPKTQRVDDYFLQLLGPKPADQFKKPETVRGQLGELAKRFGLERKRVLTVEEEQNFTNFLILVDYTNSLFQTWTAQKPFLMRNGSAEKFLGTQLVRLSQALAVIVESVQE